jgi:hypothetical protein
MPILVGLQGLVDGYVTTLAVRCVALTVRRPPVPAEYYIRQY